MSAEVRRPTDMLERTMLALRDARDPEDVLGIVTRTLARDFKRTCTTYQVRDGMLRPVATSDFGQVREAFPAADVDLEGLRLRGLLRRGRQDLLGISADGTLRAVVCLDDGPPELADDDGKYLRAVGAHVSLALENAHAFDQLRRYAAEGAALTEAAKTILSFTDLESLAIGLSRLCARLVPADYVAVYARRGEWFVRVGFAYPLGKPFATPVELPPNEHLALATLATLVPGMPLVVSSLDVRVHHETESLGILVCLRAQPFERAQQRMIETFATLATLAIRNVDLYEQSTLANRALAETNAFKDDLMAMFAHDFKGPLTVISGFSELLFDSDDPNVRRTAETIVAQTRRLARLSDDALALAATQSAGFSLQRRSDDVTAFLSGHLDAFDRDRRVTLRAPAEPVVVSFDRTRLRHVIDNVVGNALKYSTGPVTVRVETDGREVTVAVSDAGIGIPAEDLEAIFTRFGRGGNAKTSGVAGSGVGLYIAKKIVEVHGGRLEVASTENRGSTFRIVLPAAAP